MAFPQIYPSLGKWQLLPPPPKAIPTHDTACNTDVSQDSPILNMQDRKEGKLRVYHGTLGFVKKYLAKAHTGIDLGQDVRHSVMFFLQVRSAVAEATGDRKPHHHWYLLHLNWAFMIQYALLIPPSPISLPPRRRPSEPDSVSTGTSFLALSDSDQDLLYSYPSRIPLNIYHIMSATTTVDPHNITITINSDIYGRGAPAPSTSRPEEKSGTIVLPQFPQALLHTGVRDSTNDSLNLDRACPIQYYRIQ